jgi:RNA polymerase sigma-70 factor (ECF subfamily)
MTNRDAELASKVSQGDQRAFAMLVAQYEKPIFNLALRMVSDRDDAADVTQNVFVKAYTKINLYDPAYAFFSWIYRIAVNESINLINRRKRRRNLELETPALPRTPEEEYRQSEMGRFIQRALAEMSLEHRVVIVLKHLLLLPYREIAVILDIPEKTVKSRLFSARQALRDRLVEQGYAQ